MLNKKYFSITEIAECTGLALHKLRYIENNDQNVNIVKIRGRRYYNKQVKEYILNTYTAKQSNNTTITQQQNTTKQPPVMISKIDELINKLNKIKEQ